MSYRVKSLQRRGTVDVPYKASVQPQHRRTARGLMRGECIVFSERTLGPGASFSTNDARVVESVRMQRLIASGHVAVTEYDAVRSSSEQSLVEVEKPRRRRRKEQ